MIDQYYILFTHYNFCVVVNFIPPNLIRIFWYWGGGFIPKYAIACWWQWFRFLIKDILFKSEFTFVDIWSLSSFWFVDTSTTEVSYPTTVSPWYTVSCSSSYAPAHGIAKVLYVRVRLIIFRFTVARAHNVEWGVVREKDISYFF